MTEKIQRTLLIPDELGGMRLDQALTKLLPEYSRTQIQEWIKNQEIQLNNQSAKNKTHLLGGETISINAQLKAQPQWQAQAIQLDIIHEDKTLLVINKPAGMVVHPGAGNFENTLLNALLHHEPALNNLPRAGIVHRLDKDTSGLLVIAKTPAALKNLTLQLKEHTATRIYQAVVCGVMTAGGTIEKSLGRHPVLRKRMAVMDSGKPAITHYRVIKRYRAHTHIKVQLETGRTHQIRVHMASIQYPIFGDATYGQRLQLPKGASKTLVETLRNFKRQALHAAELSLLHPRTKKSMTWQAPLPDDMKNLLEELNRDLTGSRA